MRVFLQRLLIASQWGASLALAAGCGGDIEQQPPPADGGPSDAGATDADPGITDAGPLPEAGCQGPIYDGDGGGYFGQCCDQMHCTARVNGACPSAKDAMLTNLPPGSGTCMCTAIRGPYENPDPAAADACCYLVGSISCEGRPLLVGGAPRLADVIDGPSDWSRPTATPQGAEAAMRAFHEALAALDADALKAEDRALLAHRWAERGRNEHASVASFGRFAMSLMAVGAPPALLEAAHHAALDEVRHARLCVSLASAYAGEPLGFGPLRVEGAFEDMDSLEAVTIGTVIEGCVGETLSALEAAATAAQAGPRAVRLALEIIAEDEARHAELGWAFVRWALAMGGASLRARVAAAFEDAMRSVTCGPGAEPSSPRADHGFLPADELLRLRRKAVAEVIRPAVLSLMASTRRRAPARPALFA
jgi:hypothetical protein